MKKWMMISGGIVVLAVIVVASIRSGDGNGEAVYLEKVKTLDIESTVSAPGEIEPKVMVNISAHVIGKIEKLYFEEGDYVTKGQKLVELERFTYEANWERSRSLLESSHIEARRREVALRDAELRFKRAGELKDQGIQADELYDRALLDLENAKAGLDAARESVRQAQAALKQATEDLSRTTIVAPIDGKIVQKNAEEGEVVITGTMNNPGSVIAVIADMSEILSIAEVGETEVVDIRVGQVANVSVDAVSDKTYTGKVVEIGSSASTRAAVGAGIRYFRVKVLFEDPDERLRPGMTTQVDVVTDSSPGALCVPVQSVVEKDEYEEGSDEEASGKLKYVLVHREGKVSFVEVETGISNATHVAIIKGLKGDEEIVTGPFRTLKRLEDGDDVRPDEERDDTTEESSEDSEEDEEA